MPGPDPERGTPIGPYEVLGPLGRGGMATVLEVRDTRSGEIRALKLLHGDLPGEEARCRYAALLLAQGWENKARKQLEEVEARARRLDRGQRAAEADMYRWAADTLAQLRARDS